MERDVPRRRLRSRMLELGRLGALLFWMIPTSAAGEQPPRSATSSYAETPSVFAKSNLVAWCIVPFDANRRGPVARAEMLARLGIGRVAYDWRPQHVPTFEAEIQAYQKHNLQFLAFWSWHPSMAALIEKYGIRPQLWITNPSPDGPSQAVRVQAAVRKLMPLATQAKQLRCALALYNHGGWGGEPENLVAVCRQLRESAGTQDIGIVYNLHHGHGHIDDFEVSLERMMPYLLCLNLNGMNDHADPKIVTLGQGQHDVRLLQIIARSDYRGPIGILDHRPETDSEQTLQANLNGLKQLLGKIGDTQALGTY